MRVLNFSDGFTTGDNPQIGIIKATNLHSLADNDAFVTVKGASASVGDVYFNTTSNRVRYHNGSEWVEALEQDLDGNVTIQNDLIVNGTTVTINTANLVVEDRNITVNNGGTDVSAEGAGLTVNRESAQGSLVFDSSKASKWKAGLQGSEKELIDDSSTQTVTNKTINASNNSISNISNSNVSAGAGIEMSKLETLTAEKMIVTNPSGVITTIGTTAIEAGHLSGVTSAIQTQLDAKASTSSLTTHSSATTGVHGVSGNIVGTTDTQALTNKDFDGGTASNSSRITVPKNTLTNLQSLTRKQGTIVFDTTSNKPYYDDGTNLKPVGSGSGGAINFITDGDAEAAQILSGYTSSSVGTRPAGTQSAGASNLTLSQTTSSPLSGTQSFLISKAAANAQGQNASISFTVDPAYRTKSLNISFDYILNSGTFQAGNNFGSTQDSDLICYIYDVTNSTYIEPSSFRLLSNSTTISDKFSANFQTSATGTSYRLILHVATTSASAWAIKCENFSVSPSNYVYGSVVTDWQSYTPTLNNITLGTGGYVEGQWRRVGDSMEIQSTISLGTGGAFSGIAGHSLPSGYSVDYSKLTSQDNNDVAIGVATGFDSSAATYYPFVAEFTAARTQIEWAAPLSTGGVTATVPWTWAVNDSVKSTVKVPISGWSSSVQLSDSADTRVTAANASGNPASATSGNPIIFPTVNFDTHGAYNASTGRYTAPTSGIYKVFGVLNGAGASNLTIYIYKNASQFMEIGITDTDVIGTGFAGSINLVAGDIIDIRPNGTYDASGGNITFEKTSGPSAIAANELVTLTYRNSGGQSIAHNTMTTLTSWTKLHDSHSCFNATTGIFTAPIAGTYNFSIGVTFGDTTGANDRLVRLYNENTSTEVIDNYRPYNVGGSGITMQTINIDLQLNAGDRFSIRVYQGSGSSQFISAAPARNYISIKRLGF